MTANLPDGRKRPILNVNSDNLLFVWNLPQWLNIGDIKRVLQPRYPVKFVETFEAWKEGRKSGQIIIDFINGGRMDDFASAISNKQEFCYEGVDFMPLDPKMGHANFFKFVLEKTGVDLWECKGVPPTFDYKNKVPPRPFNTFARADQQQQQRGSAGRGANAIPLTSFRNNNWTAEGGDQCKHSDEEQQHPTPPYSFFRQPFENDVSAKNTFGARRPPRSNNGSLMGGRGGSREASSLDQSRDEGSFGNGRRPLGATFGARRPPRPNNASLMGGGRGRGGGHGISSTFATLDRSDADESQDEGSFGNGRPPRQNNTSLMGGRGRGGRGTSSAIEALDQNGADENEGDGGFGNGCRLPRRCFPMGRGRGLGHMTTTTKVAETDNDDVAAKEAPNVEMPEVDEAFCGGGGDHHAEDDPEVDEAFRGGGGNAPDASMTNGVVGGGGIVGEIKARHDSGQGTSPSPTASSNSNEANNGGGNNKVSSLRRSTPDSPQFTQYRDPRGHSQSPLAEDNDDEDDEDILPKAKVTNSMKIVNLEPGFNIAKLLEALQASGEIKRHGVLDKTTAVFTFAEAADCANASLMADQQVVGKGAQFNLVSESEAWAPHVAADHHH